MAKRHATEQQLVAFRLGRDVGRVIVGYNDPNPPCFAEAIQYRLGRDGTIFEVEIGGNTEFHRKGSTPVYSDETTPERLNEIYRSYPAFPPGC